jgi:esterase/lipase
MQVQDLVTSHRNVPRCLIGCILGCLIKTAKKKTGVNIAKVKPIDLVRDIRLPAFFMVGKDDVLAKPVRVKELYDKYAGEEKQFFLIEGTHQSMRDQVVVKKAVAFIMKTLDLEQFKQEKLRQSHFDISEETQSKLASNRRRQTRNSKQRPHRIPQSQRLRSYFA